VLAMDEGEHPRQRGAIVKRRWAILPGRGGRAVILATIGAIALGSANPGSDPGQSAAQGDTQEVTAAQDDDPR
jgi:hypothetical protein